MPTLEKVTLFITRETPGGRELLLFEHPTAGVQIPAGTVEEGEAVEAAALREAGEESGLAGFTIRRFLGTKEERHPDGLWYIAQATPVYSRPDAGSFDWARIPRGAPVSRLREDTGYTQVSYAEGDRFPDPQFTSYQITGWVAQTALAETQQRHFYWLDYPDATPTRWRVTTDHHVFTLFWAAVERLPEIVWPQRGWLEVFRA